MNRMQDTSCSLLVAGGELTSTTPILLFQNIEHRT